MKLDRIFRKMIEVGRKADWRDAATLDKQLAERQAEYARLSGNARTYYDAERLWNPFGDSRVCSGDPQREIRGMVVGINCSLAGLLYAERLREQGRPIDAFLAHHGIPPAGTAYDDISNTHFFVLRDYGVPEDTARRIVSEAIRGYYLRMVGEPTAFELNTDLALFSVHNPMDNLTGLRLSQVFDQEKPRTAGDVIDCILSVEEFQIAAKVGIPPMLAAGSLDAPAGEIYVDVLGGICLNDAELTALLETKKVQTVVRLTYGNCIRICREHGVNCILFPHNAHDNLGINLILDQVVAEEPIEVYPTDGFYRVPRTPLEDFTWPQKKRMRR